MWKKNSTKTKTEKMLNVFKLVTVVATHTPHRLILNRFRHKFHIYLVITIIAERKKKRNVRQFRFIHAFILSLVVSA